MFFAIASCYNNVKYNIKLYNINLLYYIDLYKRNNYVAQMHQPQQKKTKRKTNNLYACCPFGAIRIKMYYEC